METKGTKELKELLDLVLTGVEIAVDASKDGHVGVEDLGLLLKLAPVVQPAIDGIGEIPAELADLSAEEAADVVAYVMGKLAIDDAKARLVIEKALEVLISTYELIKAVKAA